MFDNLSFCGPVGQAVNPLWMFHAELQGRIISGIDRQAEGGA
jgi:hypothetical protein